MRELTIKSLLRTVDLFHDLSDEEIMPVIKIAYTKMYGKRKHVFMQGEPLENVYFILSGTVKIYKTDLSGKEQIVSLLQQGDMFPHIGFFKRGHYPAHAEIVEDAKLVIVPIDAFEKILMTTPLLAIKLFRVMGEEILDLQKRLEEQILHNSYEQIVKMLLRLAKNHGVPLEGGFYQLTTQFTNKEMANMIGSARETVSRTINQFKKKGSITVDENGYFIINTTLLENELMNE